MNGLNVSIGTTFDTDGVIFGKTLPAVQLSASDLVAACAKAAEPGLSALVANVKQIHPVTGRLSESPRIVTRQYKRNAVAIALVGYEKGVAPHAYLIEYGTKERRKRGKVTGKAPLGMAFLAAKTSMEARLKAQLEQLMEKAASKAIG